MLKALQNYRATALIALALIGQPLLTHAQIPGKQAAKDAKITPDLLSLQQTGLITNATPPPGLQKLNRLQTRGNAVAIEAVAAPGHDGQALLTELQALGLTDGIAYKQLVFGYLPVDRLGNLKNVSALRFATPAYKPFLNVGAVTSQGDKAMRSDVARQNFGVTGAGSKIGILSDSYNSLGGAAAGVASGDLPVVQVIADFIDPFSIDEGRGMAELVHDVAPGAAIAFNTAFNGQAGFAKGIKDLAAAGCNIITDDVYYINAPFFQDGIVAQAIKDVVTNNKVTYFTSVGNNERSSYQSPYVKGADLRDPFFGLFGTAHNFGGGDYFQKITLPAFGQAVIGFQWDDNFYSVNGGAGAKTDMDIFVFYNGSFRADLSSYRANIGDDPFEVSFIFNNTNAPVDLEIVLARYLGPDPNIVKWINFNSSPLVIEYDTKSSSVMGHSNEATAISVGAARYDATPAFNSSLTTAVIEPFSTAGGTPTLFDEAGNRITPVIRQKPEITAVDGGNTTFFGFDYEPDGFPNFFGTSASAPHAAAVAALMQQRAGNTLSKGTILSIMEQTALDMDDPLTPAFDTGFDFRTGYGFIQADKALQAVSNLLSSPLSITGVTTVSCTTLSAGQRRVTFTPRYSGLNGQPVSFSVVNELAPTTSPGPYTLNLYTDNPVITLRAAQAGTAGEASFAYNWLAACGSGTPTPTPGTFALTSVTTASCATVTAGQRRVTFTPQYSGLNGQPITFSVVNETLPTTTPGPYTLNLYTDNPVITLRAAQAGTAGEVTFSYNWLAACGSGSARRGVVSDAGMQVRVLGNPIGKETAEVEIRGVAGQLVTVQLMDSQGRVFQQRVIGQAGTVERVELPVGGRKGLLLLNVGTTTERKDIKLMKP